MITLPIVQDNDLVLATINGTRGWLRITGTLDGVVKIGAFMPLGTKVDQQLNDPAIEAPEKFVRAEFSAGSVFEALVRSLGVAAAVHFSRP